MACLKVEIPKSVLFDAVFSFMKIQALKDEILAGDIAELAHFGVASSKISLADEGLVAEFFYTPIIH